MVTRGSTSLLPNASRRIKNLVEGKQGRHLYFELILFRILVRIGKQRMTKGAISMLQNLQGQQRLCHELVGGWDRRGVGEREVGERGMGEREVGKREVIT